MMRIRLVEEQISKEYKFNEIRCPTHLSIGQEATAVASGQALSKNDYSISTHRAHAHYLAKGGSLSSFICELYGKVNGCSSGLGGSMHLIDKSVNFMGSTAIVGNSIPIGVGLGLAIKKKRLKSIVCIYLGDAATEQGVFYESINFAVIHNLPILFLCENNFLSVYSELKWRQPNNRKIYQTVKGLGIKSLCNSSHDVLKIYKDIKYAINNIKKKNCPFFIELQTFRYFEHCGPNVDDHLKYRNEKKIEYWKKKDSIKILEREMVKEKILKEDLKKTIFKEIMEEINIAFSFAKKSKIPNFDRLKKTFLTENL